MINARSESDFLYRGLRALVGFRLSCLKAWLRHGHVVRCRAIADYLATHDSRKLHLGATRKLPGFLNSQVTGYVPLDITRPLPLPDESFDLIYSSHLLEHIHRKQILAFLEQSYRVLRPGGQNIIATPSIEKISRTLYGGAENAQRTLIDDGRRFCDDGFHTPCHQINLTMRAFGHRFLVDEGFMQAAGDRIGFTTVERVDNLDLPDAGLRAYVSTSKSPRWHAETETFVLTK